MTPISDVLQPDHVNLALSARSRKEAVEAVMSKLNGDPRVTNFAQLEEAVRSRNAPAISENGWGICLAHGRTDSVTELVMAAGRVTPGFTCRDVKEPVRLVFVAGIPSAFDSEYLRIVGVIARICRDRHQFERLLAAKAPEDFIHLLGAAEVKL